MFEKILVPLDGSKVAEQVLPAVAELAEAFQSQVTLIGICEPDEKEHDEACRLYIGGIMDRLRRSLPYEAAIKVKTAVYYGKAAGEILRYAEENAISLIIMASHGSSGIVPWSFGSTVHNVLQKAGLPILVIRAQQGEAAEDSSGLFRQIIVPLDGSDNSVSVLPYITDTAGRLNSELYLLRVVEAGKQVHTIGGLNYIPYKDQDITERKCRSIQYLKEIAAEIKKAAGLNCVVLTGDAAKEIMKFADEQGCRLIAVSSHGESAISAWAHGSVTYKLLHNSKQSILFVPSRGIK